MPSSQYLSVQSSLFPDDSAPTFKPASTKQSNDSNILRALRRTTGSVILPPYVLRDMSRKMNPQLFPRHRYHSRLPASAIHYYRSLCFSCSSRNISLLLLVMKTLGPVNGKRIHQVVIIQTATEYNDVVPPDLKVIRGHSQKNSHFIQHAKVKEILELWTCQSYAGWRDELPDEYKERFGELDLTLNQ